MNRLLALSAALIVIMATNGCKGESPSEYLKSLMGQKDRFKPVGFEYQIKRGTGSGGWEFTDTPTKGERGTGSGGWFFRGEEKGKGGT